MPKSQNSENSKKDQQINVKMEGEFQGRFVAACEIQQHQKGQLARILIEWALPFYERARSVEALYATSTDVNRALDLERTVYERGRPARDRKQSER